MDNKKKKNSSTQTILVVVIAIIIGIKLISRIGKLNRLEQKEKRNEERIITAYLDAITTVGDTLGMPYIRAKFRHSVKIDQRSQLETLKKRFSWLGQFEDRLNSRTHDSLFVKSYFHEISFLDLDDTLNSPSYSSQLCKLIRKEEDSTKFDVILY